MRTLRHGVSGVDGYAMAALLVGMAVMAIFLSMALPAWKTAAQREKEAELIFRGQQYARAIMLFQRKYANAFPPNLDILLNEHFLRKKYKDPMTESGEFQLVYANQQGSSQPNAGPNAGPAPGATGTVPTQGQPQRPATTVGGGGSIGAQGGIVGVASKSTATGLRVYNGRDKYNEWVFVALQTSGRAGAPNGSQNPTGNPFGGGAGGRDGRAGNPFGGGVGGGVGGPGGRGQGNPPGRGPGNQQPGPFGRPGGAGAPGGTPFGTPFGRPAGPGPGR